MTNGIQRFFLLFVSILFVTKVIGQTKAGYPTLEYYDIQKLNIPLPYIKYYGADSSLLVFGSNHTLNFNDPQIKQINDVVFSFNPTVILYEGDGISKGKSQRETVGTYFEMGLAKYIADSLNVRAINIEPEAKRKYQYLLTKYKTEDILIATLGLQITMMQANNDDFEGLFPTMVADLVREGLPLTEKQKSIKYFFELYKIKFGKQFSYQNFDSRNIQAKYNKTLFNEINQTANKFRDQHIISLVKQSLNNRERVFLIEGGWHAIVCEPAYNLITK